MTTRSKLTLVVTLGMTVFGTLTFLIGLLLGLSSPPPMAAYPPALATAPGTAADEGQAVAAPQPVAISPVSAAATVPVAAGIAPTGSGAAAPGTPGAVAYAPLPAAAPGSIPATRPDEPAPARAAPPQTHAPAAPARGPSAPGAPMPLTAHDAPRPEPKPPAPRPQVASAPDESVVEVTGRSVPEPVHAVQVGRFLSRPSAEALAGELIARGYDARVVAAQSLGVPTKAEWYLVTIGPQPDRPTADRVAHEVSAITGLPAQSVSWATNAR